MRLRLINDFNKTATAYLTSLPRLALPKPFITLFAPVIRTEVGADVMLILQTGQSEVFTDTLLVSVEFDVSRSAAFALDSLDDDDSHPLEIFSLGYRKPWCRELQEELTLGSSYFISNCAVDHAKHFQI